MARSIDSIVDSHRRARALRAEGNPIWTYRVDIRSIISESRERSVERVVDVANRIAAALRRGLPAAYFDVTSDGYDMIIDEAVEDLESYTVEGMHELAREGLNALEMIDGRLEEIYDWADRERVWLG